MEGKERIETVREIEDLGSRLYYCSNSADGRKMRKWIEKEIKKLEKKLNL